MFCSFTLTNKVEGNVAKSDEARAPRCWLTMCSATSSCQKEGGVHYNGVSGGEEPESSSITFSLARVSLRDCNRAVCSSSWALGVTVAKKTTQGCLSNSTRIFPVLTWRLPSDVHHLDIGAHLQKCFQELVRLAIEGAGEHFRMPAIPGGKLGHMKRRQRGELSAHFLSLGGRRCLHGILFLFLGGVQTFSLLFSFFSCLMQSR